MPEPTFSVSVTFNQEDMEKVNAATEKTGCRSRMSFMRKAILEAAEKELSDG